MKNAYNQNNREIKTIIEYAHFGMVKITLNFGFGANLIISFGTYIFTGRDESALVLPIVLL